MVTRFQGKQRPHAYLMLPAQKTFLDALEFCHIKKGINKQELQTQMRICIPGFYKRLKEEGGVSTPSAPSSEEGNHG